MGAGRVKHCNAILRTTPTLVRVVISMLLRRVYMWNCQSSDFFRVSSLVFRKKSSASLFCACRWVVPASSSALPHMLSI